MERTVRRAADDVEPEVLAQIRRMYQDGYGYGQLAAMFRRGDHVVRGWVADLERGPKRHVVAEEWEIEAARRLHAEGQSVEDVARAVRRSAGTVSYWLLDDARERTARRLAEEERLKTARAEFDRLYELDFYSQEALSRKVGVSPATIAKWRAAKN